jgi:PAS domain S-box-containing protein
MDFSRIFQKAPDNYVVLSPDYIVLAATEAYLKTTLRTLEEIQGRHFLLEAYPDKDYSYEENPVKLSLDRVVATKQIDHMDLVRYHIARPAQEGGGYYESFWEASHTPILDDQGTLQYIVQKTEDVTERELAKQAQQASEKKFNIMTDTIPQLVFTFTPQLQVTYVNSRWEKYTGFTAQQALQPDYNWEIVIHPQDLPDVKSRLEETIANKKELQMEARFKNHEGAYRWFLCRIVPVLTKDGSAIETLVGSCTEVHSTKLMVQELLDSAEQMSALADQVTLNHKKAESRRLTLERLIMQAPVFFCILNGPNHRYELANEKYQQLLPNKELIGRTVLEVLPEVEDQGLIAVLDNVYQTGETFTANNTLVRIDKYNDGTLQDLYLSFVYQAMYDEEQKITGILVCGYDTTESVLLKQATPPLPGTEQQ